MLAPHQWHHFIWSGQLQRKPFSQLVLRWTPNGFCNAGLKPPIGLSSKPFFERASRIDTFHRNKLKPKLHIALHIFFILVWYLHTIALFIVPNSVGSAHRWQTQSKCQLFLSLNLLRTVPMVEGRYRVVISAPSGRSSWARRTSFRSPRIWKRLLLTQLERGTKRCKKLPTIFTRPSIPPF